MHQLLMSYVTSWHQFIICGHTMCQPTLHAVYSQCKTVNQHGVAWWGDTLGSNVTKLQATHMSHYRRYVAHNCNHICCALLRIYRPAAVYIPPTLLPRTIKSMISARYQVLILVICRVDALYIVVWFLITFTFTPKYWLPWYIYSYNFFVNMLHAGVITAIFSPYATNSPSPYISKYYLCHICICSASCHYVYILILFTVSKETMSAIVITAILVLAIIVVILFYLFFRWRKKCQFGIIFILYFVKNLLILWSLISIWKLFAFNFFI